ncbi:energy-coupling factor transporter ATP-binding protein EcfA2 [Streptacidiphilus sp. BW17]|uniref:kinase n=1 Tax=Streptacidiphilus sp. BW17 TaxID=3156274 RepID=UPI003513ADFF
MATTEHPAATGPVPIDQPQPQRTTLPADDRVLIVLRGPSAVGKTTIAKAIRTAYAHRHLALVHQDVLRREVLRERDVPGGHNIELIRQTAMFALGHGFHTVVEGILDAGRYGHMLGELSAAHTGPQHWFYLHAPLEVTVARHATKAQAAEYGDVQLREWYRELDLLPDGRETVIGPDSTAEQTLDRILQATGLLDLKAPPVPSEGGHDVRR